jgi:nanoRNase/pAp phosphatase (c-di-AMP/oligoRNAs hydrolase)
MNETKRFFQNLKRQAEENPLMAIAITAGLLTATSKLMDANTARMSARTHLLEVERRIRNTSR